MRRKYDINNNYEVAEFKNGEFKLDVSITPDSETAWLTID